MPKIAEETVDITSLIKGILNSYPGNSAIFREYLQNSDDAKATKQIFLLDDRHHPTDSLVDPILADTQGPALIAWNDQLLTDRDWTALKTIHASSKSSDETQTGKNGLGFRTSYHLTENPQILSGQKLLILDPHKRFREQPGGAEIDIITEGPRYANQLRSFESILKEPFKEFQGTVFRLPFRTQKQANRSQIKRTPTSVKEMKELLSNFCQELEEAILFLKHITSIEIRMVSDAGEQVMGTATIDPRTNNSMDTFIRQITISGEKTSSRAWKYFHYKVDRATATNILSKRLRQDVGNFMVAEKLNADVELAFPLNPSTIFGRLFTLLPLPIKTGFPVHFNAVFALTPDRQSLKNIEEGGTGESRESRLIEWNRTIFDDFGAKAWARLLSDLAGDITNVWSAWPPQATHKNPYWISLVPNIIQEAKTLNILPIISSSTPPPLVSLTDRSVLLAPPKPPSSLNALAKMGVSIVQPPAYIFDILASPRFEGFFTKLSPASSYERLHALRDSEAVTLPAGSAADIKEILSYLVFWGNKPANLAFERLIDLPWFAFKDGPSTCLRRQSLSRRPFIVPGSEEETRLFDIPGIMLAWPCIYARLRDALSTPKARETLNVDILHSADILRVLKARFSSRGRQEEVESIDDDITWVLRFWKWISGWKKEEFEQLAWELGDLHILPTSRGTLKKWSNVPIVLEADPAEDLLNAWKEIGISNIHPGLAGSGVSQILQNHGIGILASNPSYVSFLACNYSCDELSSITSKSRHALRLSIRLVLMGARGTSVSLSPTEKAKLSSLPLFFARTGNEGPPNLHPISGDRRHVKVDNEFPLPVLPSTQPLVYIDMNNPLTDRLARLIDSSTAIQILDEIQLLTLAVDHWSLQPQSLMDTFVEHILERLLKFPFSFWERLKGLAFLTVEGETQRAAPRDVIDPGSKLVELYKGEVGKIICGRFSRGKYLKMMQSQQFLRSKLDLKIVTERLGYLASTRNDEKAAALLRLLDASWDESFAEIVIAHREVEWMPSSHCPSKCRDDKESPRQHYLYDHTFAILRPKNWSASSPGLRKALGWSDCIPFEVLAEQFSFTVGDVNLADRTARLKYLISYFATYPTLSSHHLDQLLEIAKAKGEPWVPVRSRSQPVSLIQHATLSKTSLVHPFHQAEQASEPQYQDFLRRMGCTDRPSMDTLTTELKKTLSRESWSLSAALYILQEIADYHRKAIPTSDILIPTNSELKEAHQLADIYYQDMMSEHILGIEKYAAHSEISKGLAEKLGIPLMSSLQLEDEDDDEELQMSEDLVGRIRGFLRENDIRFALNEFLANADDAGAKRFSMKLVHQGSYQTASTINVVSPEFQNLDKVSRLIIWNDSAFTEKDFTGIRRVGFGGKTGRDDTHGRHGLGALSLYYFTDVPMIISGEHILILDPSSRYLPPRRGQKRTSLFRKLSVFMRQFPDQLRVLHDNFGFTPEQTNYDGTLFLLPLSSMVYEQEFPDYRYLLRTAYQELAANAFFFTGLVDIKADDGATQLWRVSVVDRTDPVPLSGGFSHHLLQFTQGAIVEKWMIATSAESPIPDSQSVIARELKFLPNSPMPVHLAIRVDQRQNMDMEPSHLFSTLRLPKATSLPFHLHARFAISANRQDLVFHPANRQNRRDAKSSFNAWILHDLVCPLYLAALNHIISAYTFLVEANSRDWLIFKSDSDDVSSYVGESILEHLPRTHLRLLASADRNWITFQQSVFSSDESREVRDALTCLEAPSFVPSFHLTPVSTLPGSKRVTPAYVMNQLRLPGSFLRLEKSLEGSVTSEKGLSFKHVALLAQYVHTEDDFVGLPLVVSTTGRLYRVPSILDPPIHVTLNASHSKLFPTSVFMKNGYNPETINALTESGRSNIHQLSEKWLADVIALELDTLAMKNQSPNQWLRQLWGDYNSLPGPPSIAILQRSDLKIIESTQGYISVADCSPENVLQSPGSQEEWIVPIMFKLGINVLKPQDRNVVRKYIDETFPSLFINVIACLGNKPSMTTDHLGVVLGEKDHSSLASWMRRYHPTSKAKGKRKLLLDNLKGVLLRVPIWEAHYEGQMQLLPAHQIEVIPSSINLRTISPYLNSNNDAMVVYSAQIVDSLSYSRGYRVDPMTIDRLFDVLELPNGQLQTSTQRQEYKKLLQELLSRNSVSLRGKFRVPDDNLVLRLPEELFSDEVPLFAQVLKYSPEPSFIHPSFRDLTSHLCGMGLRHEMNFPNFQACAEVVELQGRLYLDADTATRQDIMFMADSVFHYYCKTLPGSLGTNHCQWNQLDKIAFVRHKSIRQGEVDYDSETYRTDLPVLLPPSRLVRPVYEPIAWTVRESFFTKPSDHLLAVNHSLGVPGPDEVVNHLRILSTKIANCHWEPTNHLSDLLATYKWLDSHHQDARKSLAPLSDLPIFLNVDDPQTDQWATNWIAADHLVLNLHFDTQEHWGVRAFLQPYRNLLLAAGCYDLKVTKNPIGSITSATDDMSKWRVLNEMRSQRELTDICLLPTWPLIYTKADNTIVYDVEGGLPAHKAILAASIPYFRIQSHELKNDKIKFNHSPFVAQAILDFVYTGSLNYPNPESKQDVINLLREFCQLLRKSHEWDMPLLKRLLQKLIIEDHDMIQRLPQGFKLMYAAATEARAEDLKSALDKFQTDNRYILEQLNNVEGIGESQQENRDIEDDELAELSGAEKDGSDGVVLGWFESHRPTEDSS